MMLSFLVSYCFRLSFFSNDVVLFDIVVDFMFGTKIFGPLSKANINLNAALKNKFVIHKASPH